MELVFKTANQSKIASLSKGIKGYETLDRNKIKFVLYLIYTLL